MIIRLGTFIALALLGTAAVAQDHKQQPRDNESRAMMLELGAGMKGQALADAIAKAEQYPLGSKANPVRENRPEGQRAYLKKLRCADGNAPKFARAGSAGNGPYAFIMDAYQVVCPGQAPVEIYIDMYHDGGETRPVPGFTIQN